MLMCSDKHAKLFSRNSFTKLLSMSSSLSLPLWERVGDEDKTANLRVRKELHLLFALS